MKSTKEHVIYSIIFCQMSTIIGSNYYIAAGTCFIFQSWLIRKALLTSTGRILQPASFDAVFTQFWRVANCFQFAQVTLLKPCN